MSRITELLKSYAPDKGLLATVTVCGAFKVDVHYWPDTRLEKAINNAQRQARGFRAKSKAKDDAHDTALNQDLIRAIEDWRGLTPHTLATLGLLQLSKVPKDEHDEEILFSPEVALDLMVASPIFANSILDGVSNKDLFKLDEAQGNSLDTSGGGSGPGVSPATSA